MGSMYRKEANINNTIMYVECFTKTQRQSQKELII